VRFSPAAHSLQLIPNWILTAGDQCGIPRSTTLDPLFVVLLLRIKAPQPCPGPSPRRPDDAAAPSTVIAVERRGRDLATATAAPADVTPRITADTEVWRAPPLTLGHSQRAPRRLHAVQPLAGDAFGGGRGRRGRWGGRWRGLLLESLGGAAPPPPGSRGLG
jgi:hypothetical protein